MIHTIHHALSSCWLGRRPGVRTKFDKAICLISSHFIVVITLIFFVHRMILSDNYDQHLRSDFVRTYCQLAKYENFTVVLPFEEYPNGFCMHKFSVCVRPWRFENVDQLQSSQTAFHYQANIIELSNGHCTSDSKFDTHWFSPLHDYQQSDKSTNNSSSQQIQDNSQLKQNLNNNNFNKNQNLIINFMRYFLHFIKRIQQLFPIQLNQKITTLDQSSPNSRPNSIQTIIQPQQSSYQYISNNKTTYNSTQSLNSCDNVSISDKYTQCYFDFRDISTVSFVQQSEDQIPFQVVFMFVMSVAVFYGISFLWMITNCVKRMCACLVIYGPDDVYNPIDDDEFNFNDVDINRNAYIGNNRQIVRRNGRRNNRNRRNRQRHGTNYNHNVNSNLQNEHYPQDQIELIQSETQQTENELLNNLLQINTDSVQMQILGNYYAQNNYLFEMAREEYMLALSGREVQPNTIRNLHNSFSNDNNLNLLNNQINNQQTLHEHQNSLQYGTQEDQMPIQCEICNQFIPFNRYAFHVQNHLYRN